MIIDDDQIPVTPDQAYDGDYWRERAKLTRSQAEIYAHDHAMRRHLATEAEGYEKLALHADALKRELTSLD